jgi:hypothetical protein
MIMFDNTKKLIYLLKYSPEKADAISNWIFNPIRLDEQYRLEKKFRDNMSERWLNKECQ